MRKQRKLTKVELDSLSRLLDVQKQSFIFNDRLSDEFNLQDEDRSDEIDQASAAQINAHQLRFRNREALYYKKITSAFKRITKGSYGLCQECEEPIGFKRLLARPTAELCIACKEESERDEYSTFTGRQSKSLGSKVNYLQTC